MTPDGGTLPMKYKRMRLPTVGLTEHWSLWDVAEYRGTVGVGT
jgi:hypothetical protein